MKRFKYMLMAGLLLGAGACEKPLEEKTYSIITSDNAYKTAADAEAAVIGMYAGMYPNDWMYYASYHVVPTDMSTPMGYATPGGDLAQMVDFAWTPANQYLYYEWRYMWQMIFRANLVLEKIPQMTAVLDEATIKEYVAHAHFLRALGYYDLSAFWGPVPLVLRSNTGTGAKPHRNKLNIVEDQIVKDLEAAAADLPQKQPLKRDAWATKGAAYGMLCKLYLRQKNYAKVEEYARKIMALGQYDLYQPKAEGPNKQYGDLFLESNKHDNEFIFKTMYTGSPDAPTEMGVHNRPSDYDNMDGYAYYGISLDFWWTYDVNDPRRANFLTEYTSIQGTHYRAPLKGETLPPGTTPMPNVYSKKNFIEGRDVYTDGHNIVILRYADILLCLAEALNEQNGPTAEAITLVNQVKGRAGAPLLDANPGAYTKASLRDKIFQERGWELVFEMKHREDLIRKGTYVEECNRYIDARIARGASSLKHIDENSLYFPIPQAEQDANKNILEPPIDEIEFPPL